MASKLFLLIIQCFSTAFQLQNSTIHSSRCQFKPFDDHGLYSFSLENKLPVNSSFNVDNPASDLWTNNCTMLYMVNATVDGNPLDYYRNEMHTVQVTSSNITAFSRDFFCYFTNLRFVNVTNNRLDDSTNLGFGPSDDCSIQCNCTCALTHLHLAGNPLGIIRSSSFCLLNLFYLDLENCELTSIEPGSFSMLMNLIEINLARNRLRHLDSDLFRNNVFVWWIRMDTNRLEVVPNVGHLINLRFLDLSSNEISSLRQDDFLKCVFIKWLNLSHNHIDSIEPGTFDKLRRIAVLDLSNNRLLRRCAKFDKTHLQHVFPNCIFNCPQFCSCHKIHNFSNVHLNCSELQLQSIPSLDDEQLESKSEVHLRLDGNDFTRLNAYDFDNIRKVVTLYINDSNIYAINELTFNHLVKLRILNLADNYLEALPTGLFDDLGQLQQLYLSNNNLISLENDTFFYLRSLQILHLHGNQLSKFMEWNLKNMPQLKELTLHHNNWSCNCSFSLELHHYLLYSISVQNSSLILCTDDNITIPVVDFDYSHCVSESSAANYINIYIESMTTWVTIVCVSLLLLVSVTLVFVYRREMQVFIYSRTRLRMFNRSGEAETEGKLFDVFIAYNNDDVEFMFYNILPRLEEIDNPYRVCIHERDFLAGNVITDNILEAVRISSRTIILLTENFVRSGWCRFEFKAAHMQMLEDRCPRILVIVVGDIPTTLEPEMRLYLKTNTYLKWGERSFWPKLYHALPQQRVPPMPFGPSPYLVTSAV